MQKNSNLIAAVVLSISVFASAIIVNSGLRTLGDDIAKKSLPAPSFAMPDTITLSSGNSAFRVTGSVQTTPNSH